MFYPRENQVYIATKQSQGAGYHQWVVRGPYRQNRFQTRALREVGYPVRGRPVFVYRGKEVRFGRDPRTVVTKLPPVVTPTPKKRRVLPRPAQSGGGKKQAGRKSTTKRTDRKHTATEQHPAVPQVTPALHSGPEPTPFIPKNIDQQALALSLGFAERNLTGDVVHTVQGDDETLQAIALWYTGDEENVTKIAGRNELIQPWVLKAGDRLTIPVDLVTQFKSMKK